MTEFSVAIEPSNTYHKYAISFSLSHDSDKRFLKLRFLNLNINLCKAFLKEISYEEFSLNFFVPDKLISKMFYVWSRYMFEKHTEERETF